LDWYGQLLLGLGQADEALTLHKRAAELDPLSAINFENIGTDLSHMGRSEEALLWFEKALKLDPGYASGYRTIGGHYHFASGQLDEAFVWYAKGVSLDRGDPSTPAFLGWLFLDLGDPSKAEYWIGRSIELNPEGNWPNVALMLLHLYRDDEAALDHGRKVFEKSPSFAFGARVLLRDHELRAGRYAEARALYAEGSPELLTDDPGVYFDSWDAINLALVLSKTDEQEQADLLLDRRFQQIQTSSRLGFRGYWIEDVKIHALKGDKQKALSALRHAIDEGWRTLWWYSLKQDPNLESLHDEPEFQAMVSEIEADMAAQLARVREMERNSELEPIPEASATIQ
jgi:tetratricopeptide (TPR) repeat protein